MSSKEQNAQKPKKDMDLLHTRTGGAYIPPAKLKMMQEQISDKNSEMYQRLNWERLKKRIHGQVCPFLSPHIDSCNVFTFYCIFLGKQSEYQ